jgi:hypothetical protein
MSQQTKGEHLVKGLDQIRDGLANINRFSSKQDLIKMLVTSQSAAKQLKGLLNDNSLLKTLVYSMVASRNSRLSTETVDKVISDFLDILFDLSQPVPEEEEPNEQ